MVRIDDPNLLEKILLQYFTDFGPIDDIKILKNSGLMRRMQSLRVCVIQGGIITYRSPPAQTFYPQKRGPLISFS